MSNRILPGLALALAMAPGSAFAQAAADYALTHSGTASATSGMGSRLNTTLNQSMNRLSRRTHDKVGEATQNQPHGQWVFSSVSGAASLPARKPAPRAPAAPADPSATPFSISVQGGEVPCAVTPANGKAQGGQANTLQSAHMYCGNYGSSARDEKRSVITLRSAK